MQKFETLRQPLSVVLNSGGNKNKNNNKKKKKIPKIVATFVYASSQGQRTHSARTKTFLVFVSQKMHLPTNNLE